MASGIDLSRLIATYSTPDPRDPYLFDGVSQAPRCYDRIFRTSRDVVDNLAQAKVTRSMSNADIVAQTGIARDAVTRLCGRGEGTLQVFLTVCEALGVRPIVIPQRIIFGE